ncbi:chemokine-like factor [Pantherophis guttatus]|uniref:Chemokine-like factor n=1 Tax=Pantherophis guttatus TaxID=94885 RepID=A0A6P9CMZ1_PANGU|nr:chemokine-like factor [Pantherophis guttatus]
MAKVEVDRRFPRTTGGVLKAARMLVAFMAIITFAVKRSHEAFLALVIMELVITFLFYLLYLLKLDEKLKFMFWPLADAFNSLVAALFLLIVGLCATIIKTIKETLIGGVFCLILCVLCIIDATSILKKVSFNRS